MGDILEQMYDMLCQGQNLVMATILDKSGSAPREEGTKMLIKEDFSIIGTIGGGILEAMVIKLSSKVFDNKEYIIKDFTLSNKEASSIGMVCGGNVKVLLEFIDYTDIKRIDIYKKAIELRKNRIDFVIITKISEKNGFITGMNKWIFTETGFYGIEDYEIQTIGKKIREDFKHIKIQVVNKKERYLIEPFFNVESVCVIGGGHIAKNIIELTKNLDFYTTLIDDREEFANLDRFPTVDEVKVIPGFSNIADEVVINSNTYIIIVTRGHSFDKEVLAQMLKTDAKYIGMIGSISKRNHTYDLLLDEGFTNEDIQRVYSPIGLNIYAETPEEIAISIVAELIKVRREPKNEIM
jgi:xanthine dehydrogenase accessory factor